MGQSNPIETRNLCISPALVIGMKLWTSVLNQISRKNFRLDRLLNFNLNTISANGTVTGCEKGNFDAFSDIMIYSRNWERFGKLPTLYNLITRNEYAQKFADYSVINWERQRYSFQETANLQRSEEYLCLPKPHPHSFSVHPFTPHSLPSLRDQHAMNSKSRNVAVVRNKTTSQQPSATKLDTEPKPCSVQHFIQRERNLWSPMSMFCGTTLPV